MAKKINKLGICGHFRDLKVTLKLKLQSSNFKNVLPNIITDPQSLTFWYKMSRAGYEMSRYELSWYKMSWYKISSGATTFLILGCDE